MELYFLISRAKINGIIKTTASELKRKDNIYKMPITFVASINITAGSARQEKWQEDREDKEGKLSLSSQFVSFYCFSFFALIGDKEDRFTAVQNDGIFILYRSCQQFCMRNFQLMVCQIHSVFQYVFFHYPVVLSFKH